MATDTILQLLGETETTVDGLSEELEETEQLLDSVDEMLDRWTDAIAG